MPYSVLRYAATKRTQECDQKRESFSLHMGSPEICVESSTKRTSSCRSMFLTLTPLCCISTLRNSRSIRRTSHGNNATNQHRQPLCENYYWLLCALKNSTRRGRLHVPDFHNLRVQPRNNSAWLGMAAADLITRGRDLPTFYLTLHVSLLTDPHGDQDGFVLPESCVSWRRGSAGTIEKTSVTFWGQ